LHAGDIRRAVGEIVSYHKKDWLSPFFGSCNIYLLTLPWSSLLSFVYWIF
jgi:site-specific DNA-adenine methylase